MSSNGYSLSKTSFLKLEQCHKAFFLYKNHPYLRDKLSVDKQLTFKRGHDVGFYAQQLFPGGIDVSKETKNILEAIQLTNELLLQNTPVIYEAAFMHNSVLIMVDILVKDDTGFTAYEVKSSLKVSETYLKDAYLQFYVLKNILSQINDLFLVTLNPEYVREENLDPRKLFRKRSVKLKAEENFGYFEHQISKANDLLERNTIPDIPIGRQCFKPYQCDYFGTCWKNEIHESSIFNLPLIDRGKLFEWHVSGLKKIEQITDEQIEKPHLIKIKHAFTTNEPVVEKERIKHFLDRITEPSIAMDMEIWSPAIPQVVGTRCFEQLPFLVSFFDGHHYTNFFSEYVTDERRQFAEALLTLSASYNTIIVYDRNMEVSVINALARANPDLAVELEKMKKKFVDLFDIFLDLAYYHPAFKSNFSLKVVSSVLLKDVTYTQIGSGLEAMNVFDQLRTLPPGIEKETLRSNLIDYCNTDCLATLKLVDFLRAL